MDTTAPQSTGHILTDLPISVVALCQPPYCCAGTAVHVACVWQQLSAARIHVRWIKSLQHMMELKIPDPERPPTISLMVPGVAPAPRRRHSWIWWVQPPCHVCICLLMPTSKARKENKDVIRAHGRGLLRVYCAHTMNPRIYIGSITLLVNECFGPYNLPY